MRLFKSAAYRPCAQLCNDKIPEEADWMAKILVDTVSKGTTPVPDLFEGQ